MSILFYRYQAIYLPALLPKDSSGKVASKGWVKMDMKAYIIAKGGELFKQKGYEAVTVNDICTACDITKTTFYYHLTSKQDILLQLYDIIVDNLIQHLFDYLMTSFMDLGSDLNSQLLIVNLQRRQRALDVRKSLEEIAVQIIAEGQKSGQIRNPSSPQSLYAASAYMFTGYEYMWCTLQGNFAWKQLFFTSLASLLDIEPSLRQSESPLP